MLSLRKQVLVFACLVGVWGWASPRAFVALETYDFGEIPEGVLLCHEFPLWNLGDEELVLGAVAPSCACTSAPLPQDRLAPGESLVVRVCFDSSGYGGQKVSESVSIRTNDPERPWVKLSLEGYVRPAAPYEAPAKELFSSLYLLLDTRDPEEYGRGHLLGAVNVPYSKLSEALEALPRGLPLIVYGGEEAAEAVSFLRAQGFLARALVGDGESWASLFGPVSLGEVPPTAAFKGVPVMAAEALAKRYLLILDLRPREIFQKGTLPGAIHLDPERISTLAKILPEAGDWPEGMELRVWVVDEDGKRAGEAAQCLRREGIPAVALVGGLENWRARYGKAWLLPPFWPDPLGLTP